MMNIFSKVAKTLFGDTAASVTESVVGAIDVFVETDEDRRKDRIFTGRVELMKKQINAAIEMAYAKSDNIFKSGFRPAVGWVTAFGWFVIIVGWYIFDKAPPPELLATWLWLTGVVFGVRQADKFLNRGTKQ